MKYEQILHVAFAYFDSEILGTNLRADAKEILMSDTIKKDVLTDTTTDEMLPSCDGMPCLEISLGQIFPPEQEEVIDEIADVVDRHPELFEEPKVSEEEMLEVADTIIEAKQSEANGALSGLGDELRARLSQDDPELLAAAEASGDVLSVLTTSVGNADAVVVAAYSTGSTGVGFCAAWVANVMAAGGVGRFTGNACDYYWRYCDSADVDAIAPGMIIAVPSEPYSYAAQIYGHIGVYVGNGTVRHCVSGVVKDQSLQSWIDEFGVTTQPRWGWMGDVMLV